VKRDAHLDIWKDNYGTSAMAQTPAIMLSDDPEALLLPAGPADKAKANESIKNGTWQSRLPDNALHLQAWQLVKPSSMLVTSDSVQIQVDIVTNINSTNVNKELFQYKVTLTVDNQVIKGVSEDFGLRSNHPSQRPPDTPTSRAEKNKSRKALLHTDVQTHAKNFGADVKGIYTEMVVELGPLTPKNVFLERIVSQPRGPDLRCLSVRTNDRTFGARIAIDFENEMLCQCFCECIDKRICYSIAFKWRKFMIGPEGTMTMLDETECYKNTKFEYYERGELIEKAKDLVHSKFEHRVGCKSKSDLSVSGMTFGNDKKRLEFEFCYKTNLSFVREKNALFLLLVEIYNHNSDTDNAAPQLIGSAASQLVCFDPRHNKKQPQSQPQCFLNASGIAAKETQCFNEPSTQSTDAVTAANDGYSALLAACKEVLDGAKHAISFADSVVEKSKAALGDAMSADQLNFAHCKATLLEPQKRLQLGDAMSADQLNKAHGKGTLIEPQKRLQSRKSKRIDAQQQQWQNDGLSDEVFNVLLQDGEFGCEEEDQAVKKNKSKRCDTGARLATASGKHSKTAYSVDNIAVLQQSVEPTSSDDEICVICLDPITKDELQTFREHPPFFDVDKCKHVYHVQCIDNPKVSIYKCPLCAAPRLSGRGREIKRIKRQ
jgi:hypothetical protein